MALQDPKVGPFPLAYHPMRLGVHFKVQAYASITFLEVAFQTVGVVSDGPKLVVYGQQRFAAGLDVSAKPGVNGKLAALGQGLPHVKLELPHGVGHGLDPLVLQRG